MDPRWLGHRARRALAALLVAGIALWVALGPVSKVPLTVDEGQHLIGARHILLDAGYLVRHQRYVGGHEDWAETARTYWTYPPTLDALYAGSLAAFGMTPAAHGLPLALAAMLTALALASLARRLADTDTALLAVVLFLWSRAAIDQGTLIECEPFVAALGLAALAIAVEGIHRSSALWYALAGALAGAAFLLKLWLVFPVILMIAGLVLVVLPPAHGLRGAAARAGAFALAFIVVGGSHIVFVAIASPGDLPLWRSVYLGALTRQAPPTATQPLWFYGAALYRDLCVLALPLAAVVLMDPRATRGHGAPDRTLPVLLWATALSLCALTVGGRKETLYAYPLAPVLVLFAALGLRAIATRLPADRAGAWRRTEGWVAGASLMAVALVLLARSMGQQPELLTPAFTWSHTVVMGAAALAIGGLAIAGARPRPLAAVLTGLAIAWGGLEAAQRWIEHRSDPVLPVALYMVGPQEARPERDGELRDVFVSTHWLPLSYYTWRRGRPWVQGGQGDWRGALIAFDEDVELFQIDARFTPRLGGPPDEDAHAGLIQWLETHTEEVTGEVERRAGHRISSRVFVRPRAP